MKTKYGSRMKRRIGNDIKRKIGNKIKRKSEIIFVSFPFEAKRKLEANAAKTSTKSVRLFAQTCETEANTSRFALKRKKLELIRRTLIAASHIF
jgi:hypothetical protein